MVPSAERVIVPFAGEGAGEGELSWGQRDIWLAMVRQRSWLPNGDWRRLQPGTTVADIAEMLRYMMCRYPTLRTRLRFGPDGPTQVVSGSGEIALDVIDAGDADPEKLAEELRLRYQDAPYDFAAEWPVRMAVIRKDGTPSHMVLVLCHLVADGFGTGVLLAEIAGRVGTPVPAMQPLDQARWQASPAGQRQNANALRHWERMLREMPLRRYPDPVDPRQPRHWRGEFTSAALHRALGSVAAALGVGTAPVLLAVFAVALARVTGVNPVVLRPMVNNRFRPGLDRVVCMLAQYGICQLNVADVSFAEAVAAAQRTALTTYKHAYYDPAQLDSLIAGVVADRGPQLQLPCYFNDRMVADAVAPPSDDAGFRWTTQQDVPFEPLIVHVDGLADAVRAIVFLDTHVVSPADGEALLRGMETVAVAAALDPSAPTGVGQTRQGSGPGSPPSARTPSRST